ncbi:unnamed protein product [Medioppia subpectinata]|uniref:PDZ domain-containing protein n=1 Tax=Medioppia subpectinata TaxID=1979941 RepID=A0A7R9KF84_9ACAR|nr:unnamed protein product [Medioppia subpectinata]CAG2102467.1 unnamed protein product [Medioppia subpectinata]
MAVNCLQQIVVSFNRHSVRAVIPAIGLSFALNELSDKQWSDKQWSDKQWSRQWLGTNRAHMMSSHASDSAGVLQPQQSVTPFSDDWFKPFVTLYPVLERSEQKPNEVPPYVLGSGFIVDSKGLVLAHKQVCQQFTKFIVRLGSGEEVVGRLWTSNRDTKLEVIRLAGNRNNWPVVQLVDPQKSGAAHYHKIFVVSSHRHGLCNQLSDGIVTNPRRKGTDISDFRQSPPFVRSREYIQHSAALYDIDSGTALVNTDGHVIGVNVSLTLYRHAIALPIHHILGLINRVVVRDKSPLLSGIFYWLSDDVKDRLVTKQRVQRDQLPAKGIVLWDVLNSEKLMWHELGVKPYDVITRINGVDVNDMDDLYRAAEDLKCGKIVIFEFNGGKKVVSVPLVASIPAIIAGNDWYEYIRHNNTTKSHTNSSFKPSLTLRSVRLSYTSAADDIKQVIDRSMPSVVCVQTKTGRGTGSIVDNQLGLIVTNCHVVTDEQFVDINLWEPIKRSQLFDGDRSDETVKIIRGHVLYCQPDVDVAVISVYSTPGALSALKLSERTDLKAGEPLIAIGNPALLSSVSVGILNGTAGPSIEQVKPERLIKHNAVTIPGYSGGPLLDGNGAVVGVNFGGSFDECRAVLSTDAIKVVEKAKHFGPNSWRQRFSMANKKSLGVMLEKSADGFVVISLGINYAYVRVDDIPLKTFNQLEKAMQSLPNGQELSLTVQRKGVDRNIEKQMNYRSVIAVTIATNYWIQYHRRDGQSLPLVANNGSNGHSLVKRAQMIGKAEPISDERFAPFVTIKRSYSQSECKPGDEVTGHPIASGFICHRKGFVLTRLHSYFPPNSRFNVRLGNGQQFDAHLVKTVPELDLKVLLLEDRDDTVDEWPAVELCRTNDLEMGETVWSVGGSRDSNQLTTGTVIKSSITGFDIAFIDEKKNRFPDIISHRFIHHTAVTNLVANTALVNTRFQVVGITIDSVRQTDNIALAMSDHLIDTILASIDTYHWEREGSPLGLVAYLVDNELRRILSDVIVVNAEGNGIFVWDFTPEFHSIVYGLKRFDVITHINGVAVREMEDMDRAVQMIRCRQSVEILLASGIRLVITLTEDNLDELAPILAPIAVISGHCWRRQNCGQNESNEWTNTRLWPEFALRNARLNGTEVRDHFQQWHRSVVSLTDAQHKTKTYSSGFVVERGRYVVTTSLAVCGYNKATVRLSTGVLTHLLKRDLAVNPNNYTTVIEGKVVYRDPMVGLALIKFIDINADVVPPLPVLGADLHTVYGQRVVVLGMPDQKRGYVTGAISCPDGSSEVHALSPDRQYMDHNIQSAPDYNGGPVLDMNGQVVGVMLCSGIDTHFIAKTADLRDFIQKGLAYETQDRRNRYSFEGKNRLGVVLRCDDTGYHVLKFTDNNNETELRVDDQITHIDVSPLQTISQLTAALNGLASGAGLPLTVLRVGQSDPIQVVVRPRPLNYSIF